PPLPGGGVGVGGGERVRVRGGSRDAPRTPPRSPMASSHRFARREHREGVHSVGTHGTNTLGGDADVRYADTVEKRWLFATDSPALRPGRGEPHFTGSASSGSGRRAGCPRRSASS